MSSTPVQDPDLLKEVVEFWSNTSTDWANPGDGLRGASLAGVDRTELQTMIARKRHNDAVRLTELRLLRRIRQQGVTGDQIRDLERARDAAALSQSPGLLQTGGPNASQPSRGHNSDLHRQEAVTVVLPPRVAGLPDTTTAEDPSAQVLSEDGHEELTHDTLLDPAAIAFANADFGSCENALRELIARGGGRERHVPTWRALLDLYRATGQQSDFERVALAYTQNLKQTPPKWVSIPRLAMSMAARPSRASAAQSGAAQAAGGRSSPVWRCPTLLDAAAISSLQAFSPQGRGSPIIDWDSAKVLTHDGAQGLLELLQSRIDEAERLLWKGTSALLDLLRDTPRSEGRPEDEVLWQLRLTILRLMGVQGPYDLVAMDFKAAYGKIAPPWTPAATRIVETERQQPSALAAGADFSVSTMHDKLRGPSDITVELVGQLTGDINDTLAKTLAGIQASRSVRISCERLIRVDLMAAGELLNWVGARRAEGRLVRFIQVHRLLAHFFCAMGLDDQATIELSPL
jgi:ABC-type transporter Mla MlaB component